jgi:tRNA (Thr-GGU) A37 N-methylase
MLTAAMTPIGTVRSTRMVTDDDDWDSVLSSIELDAAQFTTDALATLNTFSHIEVVYLFDHVDRPKSRRARGIRGTTRPGRKSASSRSEGRPDRTESERPSAASTG